MDTLDNLSTTPPQAEVSPWPTGIRYGLLGGMALVLAGLIVHLIGAVDYMDQSSSGNWMVSLANWILMIGAILVATRYHRDEELSGRITFGRAFFMGFIVSLIASLLVMVWTYVFFAFLEPGLLPEIAEVAKEQMIEERGMSEGDAEQAMSFVRPFFSLAGMSLMAMIGTLFTGVIFSLVTGAIMKRD